MRPRRFAITRRGTWLSRRAPFRSFRLRCPHFPPPRNASPPCPLGPDLRIAKIINDQSAGANNGLTQMGAVMGTPRYMSPEQCKGSGNVDGKTDVYALGVLMFMMLTGKLPFDAEGAGALMAMHIYHPPPTLTEIEPTVSPVAEALVLSMLAKSPAERPAMIDVVGQIERLGVYATSALPVVHRTSMSHPHLTPVPGTIAAEHSGPMSTSRPSLSGVGQTQDPTRIKAGTTRLKRLVIPVAMATVLSGIGIVVVLRQESGSDRPPARSGGENSGRKVVWEVKSTPPGVEVVRVADGVVLGKTPWRKEEPAGMGTVGVTLRQPGYMDRQVLLDRTKDVREEIQLDLVPTGDEKLNPDPDKSSARLPKRTGRSKKVKEAPKNDDSDLTPVH